MKRYLQVIISINLSIAYGVIDNTYIGLALLLIGVICIQPVLDAALRYDKLPEEINE